MKKFFLLLTCLIILPFFLHAQYEDIGWKDNRPPVSERDVTWASEDSQTGEFDIDEPSEKKPRGPFYVKPRAFEIGLNATAGFSNDFMSVLDIFQETMSINIDDLGKGLNINLGANVSPVYLQINVKDKWGFGVSSNLDIMGDIGLSGKMLTFSEVVDDKSDAVAAVFAEAAPNLFFNIKKFKVKVKPSVYYPIVYVKPDISYTNVTNVTSAGGETTLKIAYDLEIYTALSLDEDTGFSFDNLSMDTFNSFTAKMGVDVSAGFEFPLTRLSEKIKFLDFDLGLDLINIPAYPATMFNYMKIAGKIGKDDPVDFFDGDTFDNFLDTEDITYGENEIRVMRPFKMLAWANWRPFGRRIFTLIPSAGFSINSVYVKPFSIEGGLKARIDLVNFLVLTAGVNYNDRFWKNSVDLALNLKILEIDIGVDFRSHDFLKSFTGAGAGASVGIKIGF